MSRPRKPGRRAKGHKGRQRKLSCATCGFIAYASAGALRSCGLPTCSCGARMEVANLRDLVVVDPEGFESLVDSMGERSRNATMRELGYVDAIVTTNKRSVGTPQCSARGCRRYRVDRFARYCSDHLDVEDLPF